MQGKDKKPPVMLQHQPEARTGIRISNPIVADSPAKVTTEPRFKLTDLIPLGEENKISSEELARRVGCATTRELQKLIESARNQGAVICSTTSGGYFLPATKDELRRHVHTVDIRAKNSLKSNTSARQLLEQLEGGGGGEEARCDH